MWRGERKRQREEEGMKRPRQMWRKHAGKRGTMWESEKKETDGRKWQLQFPISVLREAEKRRKRGGGGRKKEHVVHLFNWTDSSGFERWRDFQSLQTVPVNPAEERMLSDLPLCIFSFTQALGRVLCQELSQERRKWGEKCEKKRLGWDNNVIHKWLLFMICLG